jgi:hypothetical protein
MKCDKIGKMESGLTSQYKHPTNFFEDDIIVNQLIRRQSKTWYNVVFEGDISWRE